MKFIDHWLTHNCFTGLRIWAAHYGLRNERMVNLFRCMEYLEWLNYRNKGEQGDFVEFGVASGFTLINAYHVCQRYRYLDSMRFIGFDSFEGLPDITDAKDPATGWRKGDFRFSLPVVADNLVKAGIPANRFALVPGYFENSLTARVIEDHHIKRISYVHMDCDLYSSTKVALDFVKPLLIQGAIMDFDDYYCYPSENSGEPQAFREWLDRNPEITARPFSRYNTFAQAFTVSFR